MFIMIKIQVFWLYDIVYSWSWFYESAQAMPTYRSYFDLRLNDTYVGFMKRHSDYHVTIPAPSWPNSMDARVAMTKWEIWLSQNDALVKLQSVC